MTSTPPFFAQESDDTCAHACLRMILAHCGIAVTEQELVTATRTEGPGLDPDELVRLARHWGLAAAEQQLDRSELAALVTEGRFPIVFLNRQPIDRVNAGHMILVCLARAAAEGPERIQRPDPTARTRTRSRTCRCEFSSPPLRQLWPRESRG